jgi:5-methylcytosine-specific restriction endonuclease McrA
MSGSGNSRWIGGVQKDGYTFDFDDIKRRIRVRDNNRCRYCLYNNREDITDSLAVHHIDYNKQNNSNNNLITLCNSCHMHIHRTKYEWKSLLSAIISNDEKEKSK